MLFFDIRQELLSCVLIFEFSAVMRSSGQAGIVLNATHGYTKM